MYYVYIIFSKKADRYYVGESIDIQARLVSHRNGISRYTSIANDWELVHFEEFSTRGEAISRERAIKRMKSRKYIESLIKL